MARERVERHEGKDSYKVALRMARYGRSDWIVWSDSSGKHAARKSEASLTEMIAANPDWWVLISANDAVPMKGFDYLANNLLAQVRMGWD